MSFVKLALPVAAAVLLAALWSLHDDGLKVQRAGSEISAAGSTPAVASPLTANSLPTMVALPASPQPTGVRASEAELLAQVAERSYTGSGGVFVDHLVARGLARTDAERVVQQFFNNAVGCLFRALRAEADAQSVAYDSLLDAIEVDLYDADGPLLGALIDMRAVANRVAPCSYSAAQQAGLGPSVLEEAARAALRRAP
jgi:hypothetical protein